MHTQQVIQSAYDIAKAAKQLVMLFEWTDSHRFNLTVAEFYQLYIDSGVSIIEKLNINVQLANGDIGVSSAIIEGA